MINCLKVSSFRTIKFWLITLYFGTHLCRMLLLAVLSASGDLDAYREGVDMLHDAVLTKDKRLVVAAMLLNYLAMSYF